MKEEKNVNHEDAQITGRSEGPFGSGDTDRDRPVEDNRNRYSQENSVNGLGSEQVRGGQDGRNDRAIGSTDMDSKNGLLRMGDMSNSTMELTEEGKNAAAADEVKTNTAMVDVTTHGPDDYASDEEVPNPKAQESAKHQNDPKESELDEETQSDHETSLAETGTDLNNKPAY
ncbi:MULTISPECIES: hypothetical protein [unclassified Spirosoma]|uniref:hypothetical protein n=1 Tax=unclassified Spirosoma TaxID=2621999 RepID=UPI00095BEBBF|nr:MULTISPECIES: hypothetical protein [unclassified Spirosoma]MBN8823602.1 hypothetical protein [Spirosoma sp.]OJW76838.1 MAG: hypothetical protein BGO59_21655 [Spirosoma sp. 48-14]